MSTTTVTERGGKTRPLSSLRHGTVLVLGEMRSGTPGGLSASSESAASVVTFAEPLAAHPTIVTDVDLATLPLLTTMTATHHEGEAHK